MEKTRINAKTQKKNAKTKLDICFQHCFTERIIQRHTLAAAVCEILKHTMFMRYQIPTPFSVLQNEVSHGTGAQAQTMIPKKSVLKKSKFVKNFALCLNGVSDIVKLGKVQRIFILFGSTIVSPKETITIDITKVYTDDMKDIANTETDSYSKKVCRTLMREIVTNEEIANISKLPPRKIFIVLHLQEPMPPEYTSDIFLPKVQYRLPSRGVFHTFHLSSREHFENVCDDVVNGFVNLNLNEPDSGIGYWYASTLDLHGFKETLSAATGMGWM